MSWYDSAPYDEDDDQPSIGAALQGKDSDSAPEDTPDANQAPSAQGQVDEAASPYMQPADQPSQGPGQYMDSQDSGPVEATKETSPVTPTGSEDDYLKPIAPPEKVKLSPMGDWTADRQALKDQYAKESQENVKPSFGRKLIAGLSAAAAGFGSRNAETGARIGQEILGAPLEAAQSRWQRQEAPLKQQLSNDQAQDAATQRANAQAEQEGRLNEQNFRNQSLSQQNNARARDFAAQAVGRRNAITAFTPDDPKNPYAGGTGTTADGRTIKGVPPPDKWLATWEKNPDNVAAAQAQKGVATLKALEASGVKLTPEQRAIVASGGKITPSVRTNINIRENPDGSPVAPKTAPISKGKQDEIINQKNSAMTKAQQQMSAGTMTPEEAQASMQDAQDNFEERIEQLTGQKQAHMTVDKNFQWTREGQQSAPAAAPVQSSAPAAAAQQAPQATAVKASKLKPGDPIIVDGKPAKFAGFNAKTGKVMIQ